MRLVARKKGRTSRCELSVREFDPVLLVIQQVSRLQLVLAVPGRDSGGGVKFQVPAHPARTDSGMVAPISHVIDLTVRTKAVELDVFKQITLFRRACPLQSGGRFNGQRSLFVPKNECSYNYRTDLCDSGSERSCRVGQRRQR